MRELFTTFMKGATTLAVVALLACTIFLLMIKGGELFLYVLIAAIMFMLAFSIGKLVEEIQKH